MPPKDVNRQSVIGNMRDLESLTSKSPEKSTQAEKRLPTPTSNRSPKKPAQAENRPPTATTNTRGKNRPSTSYTQSAKNVPKIAAIEGTAAQAPAKHPVENLQEAKPLVDSGNLSNSPALEEPMAEKEVTKVEETPTKSAEEPVAQSLVALDGHPAAKQAITNDKRVNGDVKDTNSDIPPGHQWAELTTPKNPGRGERCVSVPTRGNVPSPDQNRTPLSPLRATSLRLRPQFGDFPAPSGASPTTSFTTNGVINETPETSSPSDIGPSAHGCSGNLFRKSSSSSGARPNGTGSHAQIHGNMHSISGSNSYSNEQSQRFQYANFSSQYPQGPAAVQNFPGRYPPPAFPVPSYYTGPPYMQPGFDTVHQYPGYSITSFGMPHSMPQFPPGAITSHGHPMPTSLDFPPNSSLQYSIPQNHRGQQNSSHAQTEGNNGESLTANPQNRASETGSRIGPQTQATVMSSAPNQLKRLECVCCRKKTIPTPQSRHYFCPGCGPTKHLYISYCKPLSFLFFLLTRHY